MAHLVVKAAQHLFTPVQLRDVGPQPVEDGREFARDVATAHHHQPLGEGGQVKDVVGGDDMFAPHEVRHMGRAAGGQQNVLGGEALVPGAAVGIQRGQAHLVPPFQPGKTVEHGHARAAQQVAVNPVQAADFLGAVGLQGGPVQLRGVAFPAVAVGFLKPFAVVGGVAVQLFGDAAHVHAGAAQAIGAQGFGQGHACAALGGHAGGAHAATAATDHKQVKVVCAHGI